MFKHAHQFCVDVWLFPFLPIHHWKKMIAGFSLWSHFLPSSSRSNLDLVFLVLQTKTSFFSFLFQLQPLWVLFCLRTNYTLKPVHLTVTNKHRLPLNPLPPLRWWHVVQLPTQVPGLNYTVPTLEKLEKLEDTISKLLYYSGFCWGVPKMMGFKQVTILKIWLFSVSI